MSNLSVHVLVPAFEQVYASFAECLVKAVQRAESQGIRTRVSFLAGSYISQARRDLTFQFMEGSCENALWLDGDMNFPENTIEKLVHRNVLIVGANYRRRRYPKTTFTAANGDLLNLREVATTPESPALEAVSFMPGGLMMVNRKVYERLSAPYYAVQYNPRFNLEVGEDVFFCQKVQNAGIQIWIDHELSREVSHVGAFPYTCELPFKTQ